MPSIHWQAGVVQQFDETGRLVLLRKVNTDGEGVALAKRLQEENPKHSVVYISGTVT